MGFELMELTDSGTFVAASTNVLLDNVPTVVVLPFGDFVFSAEEV